MYLHEVLRSVPTADEKYTQNRPLASWVRSATRASFGTVVQRIEMRAAQVPQSNPPPRNSGEQPHRTYSNGGLSIVLGNHHAAANFLIATTKNGAINARQWARRA